VAGVFWGVWGGEKSRDSFLYVLMSLTSLLWVRGRVRIAGKTDVRRQEREEINCRKGDRGHVGLAQIRNESNLHQQEMRKIFKPRSVRRRARTRTGTRGKRLQIKTNNTSHCMHALEQAGGKK